MHIPAHRIVFTDDEIEDAKNATEQVMRNGQMILGKYTKQFEEEYAQLHGRKYGVAVSSDTAAIEIALRIYGVGEGDKVLFPANGFYGVVIPVLRCGAEPVFFDIDWNENLFVNAYEIESLIHIHNPKALILMHTGGLVASSSKAVGKICKDNNVICIEDAAHAPGAKMNGLYAGSFGDVSCFSLYATKPINAGEGGMLLTDDIGVAELAKQYRNYGRTATFSSSICAYQGYSWRLTEIQAAIGLGQVRRQDEIREERDKIAAIYDFMIALFYSMEDMVYTFNKGTESNWYRYLMVLPEGCTYADKIMLKQYLSRNYMISIPGDVYEMPVPHQPVWGGIYDDQEYPQAKEWGNRHFALPIYNSLTQDEQWYVVESVDYAIKKLIGGDMV